MGPNKGKINILIRVIIKGKIKSKWNLACGKVEVKVKLELLMREEDWRREHWIKVNGTFTVTS